jgi:hypothetical protein
MHWSGRRGSNPLQPAWKTGIHNITARLVRMAFTGWLSGASSFSRTRDKSFHMLFSCLQAKVFTWCEGRFPRGFALMTSIPYALTIRQEAVRKGEYHPIDTFGLPRA